MVSEGWGVGTDAQWTTLVNYLGGASVAGGKLKEMDTTYWESPNTGATNEVGFNGRGAGTRWEDGGFVSKHEFLNILTKTLVFGDVQYISYQIANYDVNVSTVEPSLYFATSIRTVRLATTDEQNNYSNGILPDARYYGNDGKVYRVTKIGTQVWLADNLAETKWSDGNYIQGWDANGLVEISNAAWAALTTAAVCVYDNDESYM
jgi:hypothetical protein